MSSAVQLEKRARESMELRTIELANRVSQFLRSCEEDLLVLKILPRDAHYYRQFLLNHRRTIWTREGTNENPIEVHRDVPLYREAAFIGPDGTEIVRVVGDRIVDASQLRDVSKPENTTYRSELYFEETLKVNAGEIYVSHVTGWFVTLEEQLHGAQRIEDAVEGRQFEGLIRFATPCMRDDGGFEGMVLLSLDHRHLMELTLHILPTEERFVVFPSYSGGNYAFMFDDEGWIISHPKSCDIRGILPDGSQFDASSPSYTRERVLSGEAPFNLDYAGFINPNYPLISREVRAGRAGMTSTFSVGGIPRVMSYAPIFYSSGVYKKHGVFGGITIGVETEKFKEPALLTESKIDEIVMQTKQNSLIILGCTALAAILLAIVLARTFTRPILLLAKRARGISAGHIADDIAVHTGDELELLAGNFSHMAREIREHQESLEHSLAELAQSKKSVEQYTCQLEKQLRVLKNVHYLSHYLGTVFDRELVLQTVLKTCVEGLGYDRAILYLYDPSKRSLYCHQTFGFSPEHEKRAKSASYDIDRQDCFPTKVFRSGETIFVKDIHTEERATPLDLKIAEVGESEFFVFTPITSRDRVIGVLGADTATSRRRISEIDVESLQILSNDAARSIERSNLYGKLIAERNFIKSIVTHMTSGIVTLDESGLVTWFNPYTEKVFEIQEQDALGKHYREAFAAFPSWPEVIDDHVHSGEDGGQSIEHQLQFQDGRQKILEVHFSKIYQEQQPMNMFLLFVRDITQRKLMEEHIRRSDKLVSLGVLAAGIAHEMRNPLTGISLLMDDLHDHLRDMPEERDLLQRSLQEIDRLENLINGLLDFAVPSRRVNLEVRPLVEVIENSLFLVRKMCKNQSIKLSVNAEGPLPLVKLDPEKLQQALLNLLLNAIQAMPRGGSLDLEVRRVSWEESLISQPAVRIAVSDTGSGIPAEDMPYIFDPFFSRHPTGCGLGLAIVHSIVEEHSGRISVSSQLDKGTTFRVDLPVAEEK